MSKSVELIVAESGPLPPTEEKALLRAFAAGRVSRGAAMQRMGIDWYGELLARMNELGIRQPVASREAMKAMDTGANLLSRAMSGGRLRANFRTRLENLLRQSLALQQAALALRDLRRLGVTVELVGSVVWGQFYESSDVDFLIVDRGQATEGQVYEAIASNLTLPFDMVFLDRLLPAWRGLILKQRDRHGRAPIGDAQRRLCCRSSTSSRLYYFPSTGRSGSAEDERVVLFLDFDGVMHPKGADTGRLFEAMPLLEAWLRGRPAVTVVLSTSWREVHSLQELQDLFPVGISARVIGAVPVVEGEIRQVEIERWLTVSCAEPDRIRWAALDDQAEEFRPDCDWLVLCDGRLGLTPECLDEVDRLLGLEPSS